TARRASVRAMMNDSAPAQGANNSDLARAAQRDAYLHLLKRTLTRYPLEPSEQVMLLALHDMPPALTRPIAQWGMSSQLKMNGSNGFNPVLRTFGLDWPSDAETMIGLYRLDNIEQCVMSALRRNVPGDFAEMGVWRGGASIFMRALLKASGDRERKVWLADSFQGLPPPDADNYPADLGDDLWTFPQLAISLDTVKANFARYGLLDEQVRFLPGWFRDTLPTAPIEKLAVLRLDADMYESTILALHSLYHKVSPGGFVIVDDYASVPACQQAVDDFRAEQDIVEPLCPIDWTGVYWQTSTLARNGTKKRRSANASRSSAKAPRKGARR
ncbi:MAG TPA: TylF/MycF/NovP-related O-methyltransferase, partial [Pyrinomonadaceae bacterium]